MINGANNHSLDQGDQGITNHIQTWEKFDHNVLFTGIYNSKKEANRVHTISKNGVKISVLSYTYGTNDMVSNYPYTVKRLMKLLLNMIYEKQNNKATSSWCRHIGEMKITIHQIKHRRSTLNYLQMRV